MLLDSELATMNDPSKVSGSIQACKSDADKDDALSKLKTAYTRACKARQCESNDDIKEAFAWWDLLFNDNFVSYYY